MPQMPADEVRQVVSNVLAGEEYAGLRPTLLDRFWNAILDFVGRIIDLVNQTGQGGLLGTLLLVGMLVALGVLAARFLRGVGHGAAARSMPVEIAGKSSGEWTAEAEAHELAQRWREAVRCHHRALVAALAEAGLVEELPGRTAGEYAGQVAEAVPAAAPAMEQATRRFEEAWYAHEPVGADAVHSLLVAAARVRDAAGLQAFAVKA